MNFLSGFSGYVDSPYGEHGVSNEEYAHGSCRCRVDFVFRMGYHRDDEESEHNNGSNDLKDGKCHPDGNSCGTTGIGTKKYS